MSTTNTFRCDGCGHEISQAQAAQFTGIHQAQTTVASGGVHAWHSCSPECAARHLRAVAAGVEARGAQLRAEAEKHAADLARRKAEQERLARNPGSAK